MFKLFMLLWSALSKGKAKVDVAWIKIYNYLIGLAIRNLNRCMERVHAL